MERTHLLGQDAGLDGGQADKASNLSQTPRAPRGRDASPIRARQTGAVDDKTLLDALGRVGRRYGGCDKPLIPLGRRGASTVVVRCGSVVVKAHSKGSDPAALAARLAVAARSTLSEVLLAPLVPRPVAVADRWASVWPYGATIPVDPGRVPWADAATLLARLHTATVDMGQLLELPSCDAPARIARRVAGLAKQPPGEPDAPQHAAATVRAAWHTLPAWARGQGKAPGPVTVVHGDFHLGQLVAHTGAGWRLTDIDELGTGTPVWDFGRIAALRALGVIREGEFRNFLDAYWAAGGPALSPNSVDADHADWATLDAVARAHVVSAAAQRLMHRDRRPRYADGLDDELLRICAHVAAEGA